MDPLRTVSVSETLQVLVTEPNYPDLLKCAIVVRPNVVYSCSVVMLGNVGPVEVAFSNANISLTDIPGMRFQTLLLHIKIIHQDPSLSLLATDHLTNQLPRVELSMLLLGIQMSLILWQR